MHVDRKGDVRILANIKPNDKWMATMLHECGHAVYDKYLDVNLPYILREPAHILSTEAIALLMGRLETDPDWLIMYAGAPIPLEQLKKAMSILGPHRFYNSLGSTEEWQSPLIPHDGSCPRGAYGW